MSTYTRNPPRTVQLAKSILERVIAVEEYLEVQGLPNRSFEPGAASQPPIPPPMGPSVDEVLAAIEELTALLLGPMGWMTLQLDRSVCLSLYLFTTLDTCLGVPLLAHH